MQISSTARAELAPGGKLRIGLNYGNFLLVLKDGPGGEPRGIAPDLGRELGRRLGVPVEFIKFDQAGKLADAVKAAQCDVGFLGAEPQRANEIAFTAAYLEIPVTFLVPAGSPLRALAEVDREGVRIAVADRSAYDLFLSRNIKKAELVRAQGIDGSYQLFVDQKLEALAGLKPRLVSDAEKLPGSRILEGQITGVQQAIGTPKARSAAAGLLSEFAADIKKTGLVKKLISEHGVRGVNVAP
ncbi:MAG: polar amino acid transport system substrate-binding protein [Betaproteobacteria bacterium]|jgi:polar amino acid transport system substrate-binding protein|nr:polar amino acid transport system substrate-binding protein [Betaproteobacteria bacterium]